MVFERSDGRRIYLSVVDNVWDYYLRNVRATHLANVLTYCGVYCLLPLTTFERKKSGCLVYGNYIQGQELFDIKLETFSDVKGDNPEFDGCRYVGDTFTMESLFEGIGLNELKKFDPVYGLKFAFKCGII